MYLCNTTKYKYMNFGDTIKKKRKEKGLTQIDLAELANITTPTLVRIEQSDTSASFKKIEAVCEVLGLDVRIVVGG